MECECVMLPILLCRKINYLGLATFFLKPVFGNNIFTLTMQQKAGIYRNSVLRNLVCEQNN